MQVATPDAAQARAFAQFPSPWRKRALATVLLGLCGFAAVAATGCHTPPLVKPWQRVHLTRRALTFDDGLEARFKQHMFGAREGADGGYGKAGGGCGCN